MRYFLHLSYLGTDYCGWQRQPNAPSVQQTIEESLETLLRVPTPIVGCGRTDTGVHASAYTAHFDSEKKLPERFLFAINALLPKDIAIHAVKAVADEAHARFDATRRAYIYHIDLFKNPFSQQTAWQYLRREGLDIEKLQAVTDLLMQYEDFYPFCKSDNDLNNYKVQLFDARWEKMENQNALCFHIAGNRFLRGMVRLVVGACVQVAEGKMTLEDLKSAMDKQTLLPKPLSAPAEGLFLSEVLYEKNKP